MFHIGHKSLCPYQAFSTLDKPLILWVANDPLWRAFCRMASLEDIADDPRFLTNADRAADGSPPWKIAEFPALRCIPSAS